MVRRVQVSGNCELVFSGKCERNVFKAAGMASNLFEETMFRLKSHCPFMDKRPKETNHSRVVLQIMMFREKMAVWKKLLVSLAMFTDLHSRYAIDSSEWTGATASSTMSLRSKSTCQIGSSSGTSGPIIRGNNLSRDQFSCAFPPMLFLTEKVCGIA